MRAISRGVSGARLESSPQEGLRELVGTRRGQGVQAELHIVGLAAPAMLARPIIDQKQQPGCRQALDQVVEQGLGLGIDPVQVFEDQHQGCAFLRSSTRLSASSVR